MNTTSKVADHLRLNYGGYLSALFAILLASSYFGWRHFQASKYGDPYSWPTTEALISESHLSEISSSNDTSVSVAVQGSITLHYKIDEKAYVLNHFISFSYANTTNYLEVLAKGAHIKIAYSPIDPTQISLHPSLPISR